MFSNRDLRYEGVAQTFPLAEGITALDSVPWEDIDAYDRAHFPAPRTEFLRRWIEQPGANSLGMLNDGKLKGYGVIRACREGHKIGPLFADSPTIAEDLMRALSATVSGETFYLDAPENNPAAVAMAKRHGMSEVFGCAKMYLGPKPDLPEDEIFGVTTF